MRRSARLKALAGVAIIAAVVVAAVSILAPSSGNLRAEYPVPDTKQRIAIDITPLKSGRREYERALVLLNEQGHELKFSLFPDTGGHSRIQLYQFADGSYLVKGYFDATLVAADFQHLEYISDADSAAAAYLGAYTFDANDSWRFIDASFSPEEVMVPRGG